MKHFAVSKDNGLDSITIRLQYETIIHPLSSYILIDDINDVTIVILYCFYYFKLFNLLFCLSIIIIQ